ncbi:hypothetical protein SRHO_G00003620 [Serrasalmus rhombeus]
MLRWVPGVSARVSGPLSRSQVEERQAHTGSRAQAHTGQVLGCGRRRPPGELAGADALYKAPDSHFKELSRTWCSMMQPHRPAPCGEPNREDLSHALLMHYFLNGVLYGKRDTVQLIAKPFLHHFPPASFVATGHKLFEAVIVRMDSLSARCQFIGAGHDEEMLGMQHVASFRSLNATEVVVCNPRNSSSSSFPLHTLNPP